MKRIYKFKVKYKDADTILGNICQYDKPPTADTIVETVKADVAGEPVREDIDKAIDKMMAVWRLQEKTLGVKLDKTPDINTKKIKVGDTIMVDMDDDTGELTLHK